MSRARTSLPMALNPVFSSCAGTIATASMVFFASSPAYAATLAGPITGWSKDDVPNYISMYEYVPDQPAATPPILVISHYCGGTASGMFGWAHDLVSAADQYGFILIYPETSKGCWDVSSTETQTHNGKGDSQAIVEMVNYAVAKHGANAKRVYAAGTSSGAMMTELLLAAYPDIFKAGSEFSGVPAGCSNIWDSYCGLPPQTAQQWGDRVRAMYPGYTGYRPRIQLWHGTGDTVINFQNQLEATKEWTDVLGLGTNPTVPSTSLTIGSHAWDHESWKNSCGYTVLDVWSEPDGPHNTDANLNAQYVIPFLGLDQTGPVDPQVALCGNGGASSSSGNSGSSSSSNSSGRTGSSSSSRSSGSGGSSHSSSGAGGVSTSSGSGVSYGSSSSSGQSGAGSSSSGCSCTVTGKSGSGRSFAMGTLVALGLILSRRKQSRRGLDVDSLHR